MKKLCFSIFMLFALMAAYANEVTASYISYFYTSSEAVIFAPLSETNVSIRDMSNPSGGNVVWTGGPTIRAGQVFNVTLNTGYYSIVSTKRVSLLTGDPVNGAETSTRGYYALDAEGQPCGTEFYTYLRQETEEGEPALIVFSYQDNNNVTISAGEENSVYVEWWQGLLNKGNHYLYKQPWPADMLITSDYPISVLVTGTRLNSNPASYSIPSTSGNFYDDEFYTFAPGGKLYFFAYQDGTHIELNDTQTGQQKGVWDLEKYKSSSYSIPSTDGAFYYTIRASKPITALRRFDGPNNRGMHYIAERSGTLIGADFVFDANPPIAIFAYKDGTTVEHQRPDGSVNSYTLNAGGYATITSETSGRIMSDKAVSVVSIGTVGATFVPIPDESVETVPWPPAVFAVRHSPLEPTTNDNSVKVTWATDELCTSCLSYRRNGGAWNQQCDNTFKTEHEMTINISGFSGNDTIEYFVNATDQSGDTTINDKKGSYYSFTISPYIPQVEVTDRTVWEPPEQGIEFRNGIYTVNLFVENKGTAGARNIEIEDNLQGFLPFTDNCTIVKRNGKWKTLVSVPDLEPNGFTVVSYQAVPILYEEQGADYGIGYDTSFITYESSTGRKFTESFLFPESLEYYWVRANIEQKDYVIATNDDGLISHLDPNNSEAPETGGVLHKAAQFSVARNAIIYLDADDAGKIYSAMRDRWDGQLLRGWTWATANIPSYYIARWEYMLFIGGPEIVPSLTSRHKCTFLWWDWSEKDTSIADNRYANLRVGDDYKPEISIGRLPGKTPKELIQQMENSLSSISADKAVFVSGTDESDSDMEDEFVSGINGTDKRLTKYSLSKVLHFKDIVATDRLNSFTQAVSAVTGPDLIAYHGHGAKQSWDSIGTTDVKNLNFSGKHPLVWSISCLSGDIGFDSMAQIFLRRGASVFIGSPDLTWEGVNEIFIKKLASYHNDNYYSMGQAFKNAKRKVIDEGMSWWNCDTDAAAKSIVNSYNLYGDPKRGDEPSSVQSSRLSQKTQVLSVSQNEDQYGVPPSTIDITIPMYTVETVEGIDYVNIPEGETTYSEHGEPIVPSYIHKEYLETGYKIQNVILQSRTGLETYTGLNLPIASYKPSASENIIQKRLSSASTTTVFPREDQIFSWKVYENEDGTHELMISILPFYYHKDTTDIEFYRNYSFSVEYVESSVSIPEITVDQDEVPPGQIVIATVSIEGANIAATLETEILDGNLAVIDTVAPISVNVTTEGITAQVAWDTTGQEPGYYYFFRAIVKENGQMLDSEAQQFRIGSYSADTTSLNITPSPADGFDIGNAITITANFQNTGALDLEGVATISIRHKETAEIVQEFTTELSILAGQTGRVQELWDTTGMAEGEYTITAFLVYDAKSTTPLSLSITSRQDIPILIETEQDRYDPGEKMAVWVSFSDPTGQPLPNVAFSVEIIDPKATVRTLELSYYPAHGFYAGSFLLPLSAPRGYYTIKVIAEHRGYRPTIATKQILVPFKTLELEVSKDQNAGDRIEETPIIDVYSGDVFSYLITATNLFEYAVFLRVYDELDPYLSYVDETMKLNAATTTDSFFPEGFLDYQYANAVNPGETLTLEFEVSVKESAPHDWFIENIALITAYTDLLAPSSFFVTFETNSVEVRVENPEAIIPEPSTLIFLATGLLSLLMVGRKRWYKRK